MIQPIDRIKTPELPHENEKSLIGFLYPTHGFLPIWAMLRFIIKFPKSRIKDVFLVAIIGGAKIGKILIPGFAGGALYLPAVILRCKGYSVKGSIDLNLPGSWISIHPPLSSFSINQWIAYSKPRLEYFFNFLFYSEKRHGPNFRISYLLWVPIGIVYLIAGKIFLAKTLYASYSCKRCKICEKNCPVSAIKIKKGRPYWTWKCESCMRCINNCPQQAIQANIFYVIFLFWITTWYPLDTLFPLVVPVLVERFGPVLGRITLWSGWYILYILLLIAIYHLLFYLLKLRPINYLFTVTSLTKYYGRYKGPDEKKT